MKILYSKMNVQPGHADLDFGDPNVKPDYTTLKYRKKAGGGIVVTCRMSDGTERKLELIEPFMTAEDVQEGNRAQRRRKRKV